MSKGMVRAKAKVIDKKERQLRLEHILKLAHNSYVEIGITEPDEKYPNSDVTVGQVAAWMEFGTHTAKGIEMVPARSFLRTPVDAGQASIEKVKTQQIDKLIQGEISIETALSAIGARVQVLMQNAITRGIAPKLADSTIRRKRALGQPDTPLLATRFMFDHIGFGVRLNV
jgi:hypothetical protein